MAKKRFLITTNNNSCLRLNCRRYEGRNMFLNNITTNSGKVLTKTALALACSGLSTLAIANANTEEQAEQKEVEVIQVTGSNIRSRVDFESPSPVQTVGEVEILNTGAVQIQDVFKGLTVNSGSQTSNRQNARQGVSQFSLRGLGLGSTLTLINGRRAGLAPVSDDTGTLFTDINQYPVNMINRVEVLTDGASATYGSEAVAGVVNIITRKNFEGFEFTTEYRDASNTSFQIGSAAGVVGDKGKFNVFATYYEQDGNFRGDFDFIRDNLTFSSSTGSPGTYSLLTRDENGNISSGIGSSSSRVPDADCEAAGGHIKSNRCRYNFINQRRLIAEESRLQVFSQFNYDVADNVNVFGEFSYSRNEVTDGLGGAVLRTGPVDGNMIIPGDHPFNFWVEDNGGLTYMDPMTYANQWADGSLEAADLVAQFRPLGSEFDGDNAEDIKTVFNNVRAMVGLDAELSNDWFFTASLTYANSEVTRREPRNYAVDLFQDILNDGLWNPFGTSLVKPDMVSPKDGATTAANRDDVFQRFSRSKTNTSRVSQLVTEGIFSGDIAEMDAGAVSMAVGFQYREIQMDDYPDGLSGVLEGGRADATFPTSGKQDAYAVFSEVMVPVSEDIETQFALRYEDYGDQGGDTIDPKVSVQYRVNDDLTLRTSLGTSFQAPSIRQVAGSVGNAGVSDPLDNTGATYNVTVYTIGSKDLKSQSASNYNLGLVWQPEFINFSFDYWNYEYKDLILPGLSPQAIINADPNGSQVTRDGSGQLNAVTTGFENRGDATAQGIDIAARYRLELDNLGEINFDYSTTMVLEYTSTEFEGIDGKGQLKGSRNFNNAFGSVPETKMNGGATWAINQHEANVSMRYISDYTDDQSMEKVDSQVTVDVRYSYNFESLNSVLSVGAVNITDEQPPILAQRPGFDTEVHDPRGRQLYLRYKQSF